MKTDAMILAAALAAASLLPAAAAQTPADQLARFAAEARAADPGFRGFSAERGAAFYRDRHGGEWSCASCHTPDPRGAGRHARTQKPMEPLAPAAQPQRFTDAAAVDKWFRRNCNDVLGRECSPAEKADVLSWLLTLAP